MHPCVVALAEKSHSVYIELDFPAKYYEYCAQIKIFMRKNYFMRRKKYHDVLLLIKCLVVPVTNPWECFGLMYYYLWVITIPAIGAIACISSIDRLISLALPIKYYNFRSTYAITMILIPFAVSLPILIGVGIVCYMMRDSYFVSF